MLATNSIRGGANRDVLKKIKQSGDIYMAWSDEPWILDGAAVRISIVGFDDGTNTTHQLDGLPAKDIYSDLTGTIDITSAINLRENRNICYMADTKGGPFEIPFNLAQTMLEEPRNVNGRFNTDVVRPWANALDVVRRPRNVWIIDFGTEMTEDAAAMYEMPFNYAMDNIRSHRIASKSTTDAWWRHERPRAEMRKSLESLGHFIVTPAVAKHRVFTWLSAPTLPDHALLAFARGDDYFFGVLHSRAHEVWSLRMGTSLEDRPRYTPTTCFETFPLPWPPGTEPTGDPRVIAIGEAAARLDELRLRRALGIEPVPAQLKKRTLTNLYNARPQWLRNAHAALDRAVWEAYGWDDPDPAGVEEDTILARLLALNLERAGQAKLSTGRTDRFMTQQ